MILKGIILGFSIAAPVGPIGILCIRRTLQFGRFSGLFSGLGAAVADAMYGIVAAFGLAAVSNFFFTWQLYLHVIGGVVLIYMGIKTFFNKPREQTQIVSHKNLASDFASTFVLTITNPMTILSYIAIFAGLGISDQVANYSNAASLVMGVFFGSLLWWLLLSESVTLFRKKVSQNVMQWINRSAGILIAGFGITALLSKLL